MQTLAIAASALVAQTTVVNVAAQNIANAVTPGYTAQAAQLVSMNPGVKVGAIVDATSPGVDLATEFVNLILAKTAYQSSLKTVTTSDQMARALIASVSL
jgi:flagellar hook protein FlgE